MSRVAAERDERNEVLGIRVTQALRTDVKVEAARRGITIAALFQEMWRTYEERRSARRG